MDYRKFRALLEEGEKAHIDFKIRCDAFARSSIAVRGELAKDICAMANNGNRASYIIIGVSDDGTCFRSVDNDKLTDDNLQDFCKKAIYPPPRIRLHRKDWKRALPAHRGKDFVIIQVGPNPRQVFRLAQDFIAYSQKTCYRRNEVWIRRNATSDLATPEEIVRLASGQSPQGDDKAKADREAFSHMSQSEQITRINAETDSRLRNLGYATLPQREWFKDYTFGGGEIRFKTLWKKVRSTAIIVCLRPCLTSLTLKDMRKLAWFDCLDRYLALWDEVPGTISAFTRRSIRVVRRICVVPVLRSVPKSRITQAFPTLRKAGSLPHYYRADLEKHRYRRGELLVIPSSSEILILDKIRSLSEYKESLGKAIAGVETETATVIKP